MTKANMFAESATVGQLFDALWYNATEAVRANVEPEVTFTEHLRKARERAIGQAHQRYEEITNGNG